MVQLKGLDAKQLYKACNIKIGTPKVQVSWPKLGTPQTGGQYDGDYGKYKLDLVLDPEDEVHAAFIGKVEAAHAKCVSVMEQWAKENGKNVLGIRDSFLKSQIVGKGDDKRETGKMVIRLSQDAAYKDKKTGEVVPKSFNVTDAQGRKIPKSVLDRISSGSVVRVALDIAPYYVSEIGGSSPKAKKIVLLELVEYGMNVNDDDYFEDGLDGSFSVDNCEADELLNAEPEDSTEESTDF